MSDVEPIPFVVTRFRCPHCGRTASSRTRTRQHMGRCWFNPEARGCKTCKHFEPYGPEWSDSCEVGVDLTEQVPDALDPFGEYRKAGPIVNCVKWEAQA